MGEAGFWTDGDETHQKIAETFYRNIEMKNPSSVDSRGMCSCLKYFNHCGWAATKVEYPEYTGPNISSIR